MIVDVDTVFGFWPARPVDITLDRLSHVMGQHQISTACTCSARGICYDFLDGNEETIRATHGRTELVPVMTIDPRRYLGVQEEIRRRVGEGRRVFRLFPEYQGWSLDSPSARKCLRFLEDEDVVILLGGSAPIVVPLATKIQAPVILTCVHFYGLADILAAVDDLPHVYLSTRFMLGPGSLEIAASALGWERLVFGSHAPLEYAGAALNIVLQSRLAGAHKKAILGDNAVRILNQ